MPWSLTMNAEAPRAKILVVDDEVQLRRLLRSLLEEAGYGVHEASGGREALDLAGRLAPDAIILDLGLPDIPGVEVLREWRTSSAVPVLILSVLGEEERKIAGLDAGADDYLTKPFRDGELLARLRALLRRTRPLLQPAVFRARHLEVDFDRRRVVSAGRAVKLTTMEYALLRLFIVNRDKAMTHRQILRELWGPNAEMQTHYLRTYLMRLRQKLADPADAGVDFFQTESGVGYRFVSEPAG